MTIDQNITTAADVALIGSLPVRTVLLALVGVLDPRTGQEVSMQQAVLLGIINNQQGLYVDSKAGVSLPIPEAMNRGLIKVEFSTTRKTQEKRSDVGLMTIKTQKESRHYSIVGVIDADSGRQLSTDEAIQAGLLDQKRCVYKQRGGAGREMSLSEALDSGYVLAEIDNDAPEQQNTAEAVTKTYAIHAVVDQRTREKVSFSRAVALGLLNRDTGAYYHSGDNEHIFVGEAIKRGFIKATVVDDPDEFDIAPENQMVVEKISTIRKKLINPLKSIAAFRYAAQHPLSAANQSQASSAAAVSAAATAAAAVAADEDPQVKPAAAPETAAAGQDTKHTDPADRARSSESIVTSGYSSQEMVASSVTSGGTEQLLTSPSDSIATNSESVGRVDDSDDDDDDDDYEADDE